MDLKLFWFIYLVIYLCSFGYSVQGVTTKSPSNGLQSSLPLPPTIETNSSIIYELLSTTATEHEESIDTPKGLNKTRNGQFKGKDILNGQEQNQNQYIQGRGPPNRFPPQFNGNYNYGPQIDGYNMKQGVPRPRQPNGNQVRANQRNSQQLTNPYAILDDVIPHSGQNGFNTRTPQKLQQLSNQPGNGYPIGGNYRGLNPNQVHGNVGHKTNQGLSDKPSDGYNDQSGETESPELGEQSDGVNENEENIGDNGDGEDGGNEEVTPNEEGATDEPNEKGEIVDNNGEGESESEGEGEGEAQEGADDQANEGGEQTDFDDARAASSNNDGGEATANSDEATDADESTGQEGEQDPSNDADLAQFQNFQGGNFPGDLFPPGILSQQDLQDIQKSIDEEQKKEAEKQRAEEEGAAAQNEGEDGGEENGGGEEGTEGETDQPAASPPAINPYIPGAEINAGVGYGRQIHNQPNLLALNRALAERNRNIGSAGRPFNPLIAQRDPHNRNRYDEGFTNRGDFGTGIQDYEYERPKVNREEDEIPKRLRNNPIFNRNHLFPSHRPESSDDEDEENDQDERVHPPYLRNRFASRFDRFRPRLFNRPGRYNDDLGDYGVHRANSNQQSSIDFKSNHDNQGNQIKQSLAKGIDQSIINYEDKD